MTQLSMDEILADEESPQAELAVEQMSVDERAALEDAKQAQQGKAPTSEDADTSAAKAEPEPEPEQQAEPEGDDLSDLPESIRKTLERRPEDADNWRNLREIAKDAQRAAKEAAQTATEAATERARLEAELAALRQQAQAAQTQQQQAAARAALPDPDVDPAGYVQAAMTAEREAIRGEMRSMQLDTFETQAKAKHGAEAVEAAFAWASQSAQADPVLAAQLQSAVDPWDFVVAEKARRDTLAEMGENPAEYIERVKREAAEAALAQARAELATGQGVDTAAAVDAELAKRLPRSLAKTPGAGGQAVSNGYAGPTPMGQILGGN